MSKKDIRKDFRAAVFKRDKFTCKVCGTKSKEDELDSHHITDRSEIINGGYVASNGITVCKERCHMKVERFHITGGTEWEDGVHPDDLYKMIGSDRQKAENDSAGDDAPDKDTWFMKEPKIHAGETFIRRQSRA